MQTPSEFLMGKVMELKQSTTQVLIILRTTSGMIEYDSCGQVCIDTLGMLAFVQVAAAEAVRRQQGKW
jgi:hypothetical protein